MALAAQIIIGTLFSIIECFVRRWTVTQSSDRIYEYLIFPISMHTNSIWLKCKIYHLYRRGSDGPAQCQVSAPTLSIVVDLHPDWGCPLKSLRPPPLLQRTRGMSNLFWKRFPNQLHPHILCAGRSIMTSLDGSRLGSCQSLLTCYWPKMWALGPPVTGPIVPALSLRPVEPSHLPSWAIATLKWLSVPSSSYFLPHRSHMCAICFTSKC